MIMDIFNIMKPLIILCVFLKLYLNHLIIYINPVIPKPAQTGHM